MTEPTDQTPVQTDAQTPVPAPEGGAEGLEGTPEGNGGDTGDKNPNSEAAKYRIRAREAETALAKAQARIETLLRADIERVAGEVLAMPVDLWLNGNDASSYLTDGCLVDAERVREDAALLLTERPGLRKLSPAYDHTQGMGSGIGKPAPTFSDLLK